MALTGEIITLGLAAIAAVIWLVRLEGRVNSGEKADQNISATVSALQAAMTVEVAAIKARADADSHAHSETTIALVRVQEQLKHLTSLFERHFVEAPKPRARRNNAGS